MRRRAMATSFMIRRTTTVSIETSIDDWCASLECELPPIYSMAFVPFLSGPVRGRCSNAPPSSHKRRNDMGRLHSSAWRTRSSLPLLAAGGGGGGVAQNYGRPGIITVRDGKLR
ncbi:hypothetical protein MPTK1_6g01630 [Marchantia polymorpha subsp. ruderalis]|uniref:Uncharacterized protein n=2 Tax=Marchantia polymorpha TaxID=3197 RepID=A0AAF6BMH0_MARPO|nr:hypothetical protein MARPO_0052s0041 [Marchantia polymorpha]BBN13204.1 hypothetical protein Mp_6g01630 [Marchantia polymorpha subsp. ruderalis]|eukprot:PTQ38241.1 hypothetical protein MARPO_0052s0041 [Marchantia polymorpha]